MKYQLSDKERRTELAQSLVEQTKTGQPIQLSVSRKLLRTGNWSTIHGMIDLILGLYNEDLSFDQDVRIIIEPKTDEVDRETAR